MNLRIRPVQSSESARFAGMMAFALGQNDEKTLAYLSRLLRMGNQGGYHICIAEEGEHPVGILCFALDGQQACIRYVLAFGRPTADQAHEISNALLTYCEALAVKEEVQSLYIKTTEGTALAALAQQHDYRPAGIASTYFPNGAPLQLYHKLLDAPRSPVTVVPYDASQHRPAVIGLLTVPLRAQIAESLLVESLAANADCTILLVAVGRSGVTGIAGLDFRGTYDSLPMVGDLSAVFALSNTIEFLFCAGDPRHVFMQSLDLVSQSALLKGRGWDDRPATGSQIRWRLPMLGD